MLVGAAWRPARPAGNAAMYAAGPDRQAEPIVVSALQVRAAAEALRRVFLLFKAAAHVKVAHK